MALEEQGYDWVVTSDHGNAEQMLLEDGKTVCPSHTINQIQTFVHSNKFTSSADLAGYNGLKDVAPLCLNLMELNVPAEMRA